MTPSPEAGELTPERLAERLAERSLNWIDSRAEAKLDKDAANALRATQARLKAMATERDNALNQQGLADDLMHKAIRAAELAEQEASRWKADAERAVEALAVLTFAARTSGGTAGPDLVLMAACEASEATLTQQPQAGGVEE